MFPDSYAALPTNSDKKIIPIIIFLISALSMSIRISLKPFLEIIPSLELNS